MVHSPKRIKCFVKLNDIATIETKWSLFYTSKRTISGRSMKKEKATVKHDMEKNWYFLLCGLRTSLRHTSKLLLIQSTIFNTYLFLGRLCSNFPSLRKMSWDIQHQLMRIKCSSYSRSSYASCHTAPSKISEKKMCQGNDILFPLQKIDIWLSQNEHNMAILVFHRILCFNQIL